MKEKSNKMLKSLQSGASITKLKLPLYHDKKLEYGDRCHLGVSIIILLFLLTYAVLQLTTFGRIEQFFQISRPKSATPKNLIKQNDFPLSLFFLFESEAESFCEDYEQADPKITIQNKEDDADDDKEFSYEFNCQMIDTDESDYQVP